METNMTPASELDELTEMAMLQEIASEKIREFAPVIFFVAVVVFFGFLGNVATIIYYGFKIRHAGTNNTNVFITGLACIDTITCIVTSDKIIDLCYTLTFTSRVGCKIMHFLNHTFVSSSVLVLMFIGVDRFRKICHPFAWQFTVKSTKICTVGVFLFCILMSVRDFIILDIVRVPINNGTVKAFYCTHTDSIKLKSVVTAFQMIDIFIFITVVVSLIVIYSMVVRQVFVKHRKATKDHVELEPSVTSIPDESKKNIDKETFSISGSSVAKSIDNTINDNGSKKSTDICSGSQVNGNDVANSDTNGKDNIDSTCSSGNTSSDGSLTDKIMTKLSDRGTLRTTMCDMSLTQRQGSQCNEGISNKETTFGCEHTEHEPSSVYVANVKQKHKGARSKRKIKRLKELKKMKVELQISLMMTAMTAAFIVSFVPYFSVILAIKLNSETTENELGVGMQLALRSFVLNSAVNPYIICFFNSGYRRFVISNICRCFKVCNYWKATMDSVESYQRST